jgi:hypothetical protein
MGRFYIKTLGILSRGQIAMILAQKDLTLRGFIYDPRTHSTPQFFRFFGRLLDLLLFNINKKH